MLEAYHSGQVRRYHANPRMSHLGQTTADHQWGCAILLDQLHPDPSLNLILAALKHDGGELKAGDIPYPFKLVCPEVAAAHAEAEHQMAEEMGMGLPDLTDEDRKWLKFVDRLESMLYAQLHAPHIFQHDGWSQQTQDILKSAAELGVGLQVQQLIGVK